MRYILANTHPLDARILTDDGGIIEAGSRADAERIVWDHEVLVEEAADSESVINDLQGQVNDLRANDGRDEDPDDDGDKDPEIGGGGWDDTLDDDDTEM